MVLLFSAFPSSCSSSLARADVESNARLPPADSFFAAAPVLPSESDYTSYRCRSQPIQFRLDEFGTEMDSEDDDCSESSSVSSDGGSSFDSRSLSSIPNELDSLNERRREMLHLSISKIQTMNASNVPVSLRKSLLIYNTMKSLQRDLNEYGEDVCGSLIEGSGVSADDDMVEEEEEGGDAERWGCESDARRADLSCLDEQHLQLQQQRLPEYCWPCDNSQLSVGSRNDAVQDLEMCGDVFTSTERRPTTGSGSAYWYGGASSFLDDYLSVWGAWEDDDYNPLTNCNLSQSEILHMFGPPTHHISSQLLSQA